MLKKVDKIIKNKKFTITNAKEMQNILMLFAITVIGGQRLETITHFTNEVS
jgi:hypothetical protein